MDLAEEREGGVEEEENDDEIGDGKSKKEKKS